MLSFGMTTERCLQVRGGGIVLTPVMALRSLNSLRKIRAFAIALQRARLKYLRGVEVHPSSSVSLSSRMIAGRRGSIRIGEDTLVAFKTLLYTRDPRTGADRPIRIGKRCFIGGGSTIMPGVTIGDEVIVGAGAFVFEDVPPRSIVAGNPARVLKSDIKVGRYGRLEGADDNTRRMWR